MKRVVKVKKEQYVKAILLVVNQLGLNMTPSELSIIVTSINRNMLVFNLINISKLPQSKSQDIALYSVSHKMLCVKSFVILILLYILIS